MKSIELFQINFQRVNELVKTHEDAFPTGRPQRDGVGDDLLRAVIVFSVASFDAYLQKRIQEVVRILALKNKIISHKTIYKIKSAMRMDESDKVGYLINLMIHGDPRKELLGLFADSLEFRTFQNSQDIEDAFSMMNLNPENTWRHLNRYSRATRGPRRHGRPQSVKVFLKDLAQRRNEIVHKNDIYFADKHHGKMRPISRTYVRESAQKLRKIVWAIENFSQTNL